MPLRVSGEKVETLITELSAPNFPNTDGNSKDKSSDRGDFWA